MREHVHLSGFLVAADRAGVELPEPVTKAREAVRRTEAFALEARRRAGGVDPLEVEERLGAEITDAAERGEIPERDFLAEIEVAERSRREGELAVRVAESAARNAWHRLGMLLQDERDELIRTGLRPALDAILADVRKLAPDLAGVNLAEPGALLGDAKRGTAYMTLQAADVRYGALREAHRHLMGGRLDGDELGWIRNAEALWRAIGSGWVGRRQATAKPWPDHPLARLLWLATSEAEPWIPTPDELDEAIADVRTTMQPRAATLAGGAVVIPSSGIR
jgi:hypothetical protein